jgi:DNA-binding transcriptional ArsR family regulator
MSEQKAFLAFIGDVVGSRKLDDRGLVQERLSGCLEEVNRRYEERTAAAFLITIGDEFQGLLTSASGVDEVVAWLRLGVHPVSLRIGLGIGTLETPLRPQAIGMDGPCFHRARAALDRAKRRGTFIEAVSSRPNAAFEIFSEMYTLTREGWTARQREISDMAVVGYSGRQIAERLSITPSAVSQHLKAAGADRVRAASERWVEEIRNAMWMEDQ